MSPLIPSPIAPPPQLVASAGTNKTTINSSSSTTSPISEPTVVTADWRSGGHHLHHPLPLHQQHLHRGGGGSTASLLRSLTPDADFVGAGSNSNWLHSDDNESGARGASRQGTGSYGHNSPAKTATSSASPILPPDLFTSGSSKPLDSVAAVNLQNMAAQLSSLPGNQFDLLTASHHHPHHHLPPLPDMAAVASSYGNFTRFGAGPPRFSAPPSSINSTSSAAATSAFGFQPLMSGLPHKGLNPFATEFSHVGGGGPRGGNRISSGPPPPLQQQQLPHHHLLHHQAKVSSNSSNNSAYTGYSNAGNHHFGSGGGGGMNNFQTSILTNQGINAYLSQLGGAQQQQPLVDIGSLGVGLADLNLGGRTLSELTDILSGGGVGVSGGGPDSQYPSSLLVADQPVQVEPKGLFSRPIGAERRTAGPSPIGGGGSLSSTGRTNKIVDPYAVWEFPPSYLESLNAAAAAATATDVSGFSGLISSLSGQTLASMESLVGGGQFNGGVGLHHGHHHGMHGGVGGGGFGMPSSSSSGGGAVTLTPSKQQQQPDYSDWGTGSTSGSAPGSGNKNAGFYERGDAASVRRNIVSRSPRQFL